MNSIYLIKMKSVGWDHFEGWVVIAKTRTRAINICKTRYDGEAEWKKGYTVCHLGKSNLDEGVALGAFNAG